MRWQRQAGIREEKLTSQTQVVSPTFYGKPLLTATFLKESPVQNLCRRSHREQYHAPDRSVAGAGNQCHDFYRMQAVKNVVYSVASADFYGIYLVNIKISSILGNIKY